MYFLDSFHQDSCHHRHSSSHRHHRSVNEDLDLSPPPSKRRKESNRHSSRDRIVRHESRSAGSRHVSSNMVVIARERDARRERSSRIIVRSRSKSRSPSRHKIHSRSRWLAINSTQTRWIIFLYNNSALVLAGLYNFLLYSTNCYMI